MTDFPVTIFHNPKCGASRNTLAIIEAAGYAPTIVDYLKAGWSLDQLKDLAARTGVGVRGLLRTKGALAEELGLTDPAASDETILAAMVEHPILVERPIVVTPKGAVLARPKEKVLEVLDRHPPADAA
ncbi:arsenate reductase (glutaredoxin) [Caulobacter hibisci]|uniref:Arsenate reductase n=1 Tax=Caulobacter hibisci TaxID=2035993 RepID=A0ABS0STI2_9CAUL|nr:arsenate reductase (glutaredoxin) [Caulobacter hibisci]MBI1682970.1 arsenate reductase (glutaredoxin) [Caulobacter hibisci]